MKEILEKQRATEEAKKISKKNGNRIAFGFHHYLIGPSKNLIFILENPNIEEVIENIFQYLQGMSVEDQILLMKKSPARTSKTVQDVIVKCHSISFLAMSPSIFPFEILEELGIKDLPTFKSLEEGIKDISLFLDGLNALPFQSRQIALFS